MGAWRGHPSVKPGAAMDAAVRIVRGRSPLRRTAPAARRTFQTESRERPLAARRPLTPWTRNGVWYPNPRMTPGLVPRLLHP